MLILIHWRSTYECNKQTPICRGSVYPGTQYISVATESMQDIYWGEDMRPPLLIILLHIRCSACPLEIRYVQVHFSFWLIQSEHELFSDKGRSAFSDIILLYQKSFTHHFHKFSLSCLCTCWHGQLIDHFKANQVLIFVLLANHPRLDICQWLLTPFTAPRY